jgi:3-isopropylmalate/(R)-2-methylmalate dehydratase small subunit
LHRLKIYDEERSLTMTFHGRVWRFGDNVDTDLIIPARFLNVSDEAELARHCFEDVRPDFAREAGAGDIVIGGNNFGCGSSREHAPLAIKAKGICVVVARSFARIFYRNSFNIGLPLLELEEGLEWFLDGETVSVDIATGKICDPPGSRCFFAKPIPEFMRQIVQAGGLVPYIRQRGPSSTVL